MPPPPAESFAARPFAGLALRTQSDRRLVSLVRDGYENAFEEIVRRYGKPLIRYAAAIVSSNRAEDVTQDAFSKALLALRDTDKEIELRPWLYRIVRNTALNDLRDQPPASAPLHENIDGVETPLDAAERREEIDELVSRLRALPDPQRAAIVMRELEGLSHEEIAAALGMSGGAARQAIYRGRQALRDGAGMLVPLPILQWLLGGAGAGAAAAGGGAAAAGAGGAGAGVVLKAGAATLLVAGTVGAGVAIDRTPHDGGRASAAQERSHGGSGSPSADPGALTASDDFADDHGGRGEGEPGDDRGRDGRHGEGGRESENEGHGNAEDRTDDSGSSGEGSRSSESGSGSSGSGSGSSGSGSGSSGGSASSGHASSGSSGSSGSGSHSGSSGSGGSETSGGSGTTSGSGSSSSGSSGGDSGSSEDSGSSSGSGSDDYSSSH